MSWESGKASGEIRHVAPANKPPAGSWSRTYCARSNGDCSGGLCPPSASVCSSALIERLYNVEESSFPQLAVANDNELVAGQFLEAHRTAGVDFVGGNADLGAEPILAAVGEAGAGVPKHAGAVDFAQEFLGSRFVARDDRVAVGGPVFRNVIDGFVDVLDDAYGENEVEIFGVPIVFGRGAGIGDELASAFITAEFDLVFSE